MHIVGEKWTKCSKEAARMSSKWIRYMGGALGPCQHWPQSGQALFPVILGHLLPFWGLTKVEVGSPGVGPQEKDGPTAR